MGKKIVVIGAGAAGLTAASTAREYNPGAEIDVFTEDEHIAYSPCALIYVIDGTIKDFDALIMHDVKFYKEKRNITIHTKTRIEAVDLDKKTVTAKDGTTRSFDSLVLATGGKMFVPPIKGVSLPGVFNIKTIHDGRAIKAALKDTNCVVIVGAGVIGLMMAVSARNLGKEVTVIEMYPSVIPRILDEDMAIIVQQYCESLGIRFVLGTPVTAVQGKDRVESVLAGGKEYPCGVLILATGVRANLELPKAMGLEIGVLDAVRASITLQPYRNGRLVNDVYVAGDLIMCESAAIRGPALSQLGSTAVRQGRVAGINAAGGYATNPEVASPWITYLGGIQAAGTGLSMVLSRYFGLSVVEGKAEGLTRARYYPGGKPLTAKIIADKETHRILGAQLVGGEELTGRINWLTAAVLKEVTAEEFATTFENAYCPPTSMVKDVVNMAAEKLMENLKKE